MLHFKVAWVECQKLQIVNLKLHRFYFDSAMCCFRGVIYNVA